MKLNMHPCPTEKVIISEKKQQHQQHLFAFESTI